jgi:integrase
MTSLSRPAQDSLALRPVRLQAHHSCALSPRLRHGRLPRRTAGVATGVNRKLPGRISHPLVLYTLVAHCLSPVSPVSASAKGDRVIYRSIYEKIKKLGRQSGIGKLHPHMLRHTYGTRPYNVEQDLRFVQDQLGHASPTTTAIYAKANAKARKRQLEALEAE